MRLFLCTGALFAVTVAVAAGATAPRVALLDSSPVVVLGSGFVHGSAVRVTVASGSTRLTKLVNAGSTGAFTARWQTSLHGGPCAQVVMSAVGPNRSVSRKTVVSASSCGADPMSPGPSNPSG